MRGERSYAGSWVSWTNWSTLPAKMQRIAEVLELPIVIQSRRPAIGELQGLQEGQLPISGGAAERGIAQKLEQSLFLTPIQAFAVLEALTLTRGERNRKRERRRIPFPRHDRGVEPGALLRRHVQHIAAEVGDVEQGLRDEPLQLAERLPLDDGAHRLQSRGRALAQDQLA